MRILIDMQSCQTGSRYRGVGRYCLELVKSVVKKDKENEFLLLLNETLGFVDEIKAEFEGILKFNNFYCWTQFDNTSAYHGDEKEIIISEFIREGVIRDINADVVFLPNLQEGWEDGAVISIGKLAGSESENYISTLHDVIPLLYEDEYLAKSNPIRPWYFEKLEYVSKSSKIITVSESSKADIQKLLNFDDVAVIPNGIDIDFFSHSDEVTKQAVLKKYNIKKKFILYTGGMNPHKNLENLFKAYALLPPEARTEYCLVLAGKIPAHIDNIKNILTDLGILEQVIFTDYISDVELVALYSSSSLFAFPSYQEGFGIPVLEAMTAGAVVIASDIPVMHEVMGTKMDAFFPPFDPHIISAKILYALTDVDFRENFNKHAAIHVQQYKWERNAEKFIAELKLVASQKNPSSLKRNISSLDLVIDNIRNSSLDLDQKKMKRVAKLLSENFKPERRDPKIFIDISSIVHNDFKTGIQRVVRALSNELIKKLPNVELIYSYANHLNFWKAQVTDEKYSCSEHDEIVDFYHGDKLLYLDLHPALAISHRNINNRLKSLGVDINYVIYDLIPLLRPEAFVKELSEEFVGWAKSTSYADGVICISRSVADEYINWLKYNKPNRVTKLNVGYFHLGADIDNSLPTVGMPDEAHNILSSIKETLNFIMVGTLEPRKGHLNTIKSFEELWQQGYKANLLIVGRKGWLSDNITDYILNHPELNKKLYWFNGVSDEYLEAIYDVSDCLVAASNAEGFGLPLIEAARHDLAIIARDIPVFREVAGQFAYYFKGNEPEVQAEEMKYWIELWEQGNYPRSAGMKYFTWKESSEQFIESFINKNWYHVCDFTEGKK
ncbi:glycosyltransferase family 4 protein [Pantoea osteomyelitidis]|uniref:Glycosyltransferase family 4 protein n=1 Tax=Pantoea osteomyelitidis TaxID=3230026 RepID=A0ABW7PXE1_9GAMM